MWWQSYRILLCAAVIWLRISTKMFLYTKKSLWHIKRHCRMRIRILVIMIGFYMTCVIYKAFIKDSGIWRLEAFIHKIKYGIIGKSCIQQGVLDMVWHVNKSVPLDDEWHGMLKYVLWITNMCGSFGSCRKAYKLMSKRIEIIRQILLA